MSANETTTGAVLRAVFFLPEKPLGGLSLANRVIWAGIRALRGSPERGLEVTAHLSQACAVGATNHVVGNREPVARMRSAAYADTGRLTEQGWFGLGEGELSVMTLLAAMLSGFALQCRAGCRVTAWWALSGNVDKLARTRASLLLNLTKCYLL